MAVNRKILVVNPVADPRWEALLSKRNASLFHSPSWAGVLHDTYGFPVRAYVITNGAGEPVAGLSFCQIADLLSRRIVSLPFSDYCDQLVSSHQDWQDLFAELETHGMPVMLRCLHNRIVPDDDRLTVTRRARWHGRRLDSDLETLWSDLDESWRRAIRKARREGVVVQTVDDETFLGEFAAMHLSVRKYKYHRLSQPQALFEAICRRFRAVRGWYPLVACHQGRVIAACVFLRWNNTLYYKFNASRTEELAVRPNNLLLWEGIQLAKNIGCRFLDLGLSDEDQPGLIRFKQHLGAEEREIRHLRYTPTGYRPEREMEARRLLEQMTALFTEPTVPDEVTNRAGDMLYRYFA